MSLLARAPLQFGFHRLADELRPLVSPHQGVDSLKQRLGQSDCRADDSERWATHTLRTIRHRFLGQGQHYFRYRLLTGLSAIAYITAIGYGDK